ncbi:MAG: DUF2378 family protein [Myxococcota bacterium]
MAGVIFKHTVDAFLQQVVLRRKLLSARELESFQLQRARDVDLETWVKLLKLSAQRLSPHKNEADALEDVGREMLRGYAEGMVGRGLFIVLRLLGPKKALVRMADNYRTADNMTSAKVVDRGPTEVEVEFNSTGGMPTYVRGVISESLVLLDVAGATVDLVSETPEGTRYAVRWPAVRPSRPTFGRQLRR